MRFNVAVTTPRQQNLAPKRPGAAEIDRLWDFKSGRPGFTYQNDTRLAPTVEKPQPKKLFKRGDSKEVKAAETQNAETQSIDPSREGFDEQPKETFRQRGKGIEQPKETFRQNDNFNEQSQETPRQRGMPQNLMKRNATQSSQNGHIQAESQKLKRDLGTDWLGGYIGRDDSSDSEDNVETDDKHTEISSLQQSRNQTHQQEVRSVYPPWETCVCILKVWSNNTLFCKKD